jgi:glycosyltransferase involved in cell wall biosynthesis
MIEAMACGTPIIAYRNGSVPEIVDDGVTGFVVDNIDEAVKAVERVGSLERAECRRVFQKRFSARRMALDYTQAFNRVSSAEDLLVASNADDNMTMVA